MTLRDEHYYFLTCNGRRTDNILQPECGTSSGGVWHDRAAMEEAARREGWTKSGRGDLCPGCGAAATPAGAESSPDKPARARRAKAEPPAAHPEPATEPAPEFVS